MLCEITQHSERSMNNLEINGRDIESVLLLLEGDIDLNKISKLMIVPFAPLEQTHAIPCYNCDLGSRTICNSNRTRKMNIN